MHGHMSLQLQQCQDLPSPPVVFQECMDVWLQAQRDTQPGLPHCLPMTQCGWPGLSLVPALQPSLFVSCSLSRSLVSQSLSGGISLSISLSPPLSLSLTLPRGWTLLPACSQLEAARSAWPPHTSTSTSSGSTFCWTFAICTSTACQRATATPTSTPISTPTVCVCAH